MRPLAEQLLILIRRQPPTFGRALVFCAACLAFGVLVRLALIGVDSGLGMSITYVPAFIAATVYGGRRWGWATLAAATLLGVIWPSAFARAGPLIALQTMYLVSGVITVWVSGELRAALIGLDETRRQEAEIRRALDEAEARLKLAQEAGGVGVWDWNLDTGEAHWSSAVHRNLGLDDGEPPNVETMLRVTHPEDRPRLLEMGRQARDGRFEPVEYRVVGSDGAVRWLLSRGEVVEENGARRAIGVNIDVTDRRRAEAELRESELRFRTLADSVPILMWVSRSDGRREFVNQTYVDFLGAGYEAALSFDWRQRLHPDDYDRILEDQVTGEASRQPFVLEARYRRADGEWRWVKSISRPRIGPEGQFRGFVGVGYDVTDARQAQADLEHINELMAERVESALADRDRAESALRRAQRLEAVGQLTGGVAHDFNNLLTVVIGALDLVQRRPDDAARRDRMIESALAAARRGERLTQQLLAFARRQPLKPQTVLVDDLIRDAEPLLQHAIGGGVGLSVALGASGAVSRLDTSQFDAALMNLVVNARDAVTQGGAIRVETATVELREGQAEGAAAGAYVCVAVHDTGVGMDEATLARIFEPFFTTKEVGKGTGLGLSQVYGFARQSGGSATVESAPQQGTTVRLYLPLSHEPLETEAEVAKTPPFEGERALKILLVEDDADVAALARAMLMDLGHAVRHVSAYDTAVALLGSDAELDLLITDLVMPGGRTGADVARLATEVRPNLPIIVCSGYAGETLQAADALPWPLLRKPYSASNLSEVITQVLASSASLRAT